MIGKIIGLVIIVILVIFIYLCMVIAGRDD